MISFKTYKIFMIFLIAICILYSIHSFSYVKGVHDCSNMAAEQFEIFTALGFDADIVRSDVERNGDEFRHAWLSVNGFQYDCTSFLPQFILKHFYNFTNIEVYDTPEDVTKVTKFKTDYTTNFGAYNLFKLYKII